MSGTLNTFRHAAIYSGAAVMGRMISFIMLPLYAHLLRGTGYAIIGMIDVGLGFLVGLLSYGVQASLVRLYHDEPDTHRKASIVTTGTFLVAMASLALALPAALGARPISGFLLGDENLSRFLIMGLGTFVLDMIGQGASAWLLIRSKSWLFSGVSLIRLFVGLGLNIYLIVIRDMGLDGYFLSGLVTSFISSTIFVAIMLRDCGRRYDVAQARTIVTFVAPLIPGAVVSYFSRQVERVAVRFQVNLDALAILEMGYKFPVLLAQLIAEPFMQSWNTRRFEMAEQPGAPVRIGRMFTYFLFLMILAGLVLAAVIRPLLQVLTPPEFHPAYRIARIEIISAILNASYYHLSFGIIYAKHTGLFARIRIWSSIAKILLSLLFVGHWGVAGAAISAAVTSFGVLLVGYRLAQKRYVLQLEWPKIGAMLAVAALLYVTATGIDWSSTPLFQRIQYSLVPQLSDVVRATPLARWRSGKIPDLLIAQGASIAEIAFRGSVCMAFALLFPLVHTATQKRLAGWLRGGQR